MAVPFKSALNGSRTTCHPTGTPEGSPLVDTAFTGYHLLVISHGLPEPGITDPPGSTENPAWQDEGVSTTGSGET